MTIEPKDLMRAEVKLSNGDTFRVYVTNEVMDVVTRTSSDKWLVFPIQETDVVLHVKAGMIECLLVDTSSKGTLKGK